jgi:hypothetical protein
VIDVNRSEGGKTLQVGAALSAGIKEFHRMQGSFCEGSEWPDDHDDDLHRRHNCDHVASAGEVLQFYAKLVRLNTEVNGVEMVIIGLLADLGHFCEQKDLDLQDLMRRAMFHHSIERE